MSNVSNKSHSLVIAIDGPTASGKSTVASLLATDLGFAFLSTGILYRKVAWMVLQNNVDPLNLTLTQKYAQQLSETPNPFENDNVLYNEEVSAVAVKIAQQTGVRSNLLALQRNFARFPPNNQKGSVLEGRDITTVVCPDADIKIYLTAVPHVRAQRRFQDLQKQGYSISFEQTLNNIIARDTQDTQRTNAPLKTTADAWIIDTSSIDSTQQVFETIRTRLQQNTHFKT